MRSLNDFLELMNHEFGEIGIELTVYGIKIDGIEDGLKVNDHPPIANFD